MEPNQPTPEQNSNNPINPTSPTPDTPPTLEDSTSSTPTSEPINPESIIAPEVILPDYKPPRDPKMIRVIAGGVIALVMIIGLSIFLTILNKRTIPEKTETKDNTSEETKKDSTYLTESEKQTLVKDYLAKFKEAAISAAPSSSSEDKSEAEYTVQDVYDTIFPAYLATGAKSAIPLEKSFGFVITAAENEDLIDKMTNKTTEKMAGLGFVQYTNVMQDISGAYGWINTTQKILCTPVSNNITSMSLSCGYTSWISTEKVALANALAEAYKSKEGEYPSVISADPKDIKDSPYRPYQRITASIQNFASLFYRASKDSAWTYFMRTQDAISCKEFENDQGARHAFQGEACVDATGELTKVTP